MCQGAPSGLAGSPSPNPMNLIVRVKQVPDTTEVRIDPETNTPIRTGVPAVINPDDAHAAEAAVRTARFSLAGASLLRRHLQRTSKSGAHRPQGLGPMKRDTWYFACTAR
jgi:hypothetical protein